MSTHNLCFEQKSENYQTFLSENFQFLEVKFCIYLYRRVFVMNRLKKEQQCESLMLAFIKLYEISRLK